MQWGALCSEVQCAVRCIVQWGAVCSEVQCAVRCSLQWGALYIKVQFSVLSLQFGVRVSKSHGLTVVRPRKSWDLHAQTNNLCILTSFKLFSSCFTHIKGFLCDIFALFLAQNFKTYVLTAQKNLLLECLFAVCSLQFAVCILQFAFCNLHFAVYILQFAVFSVQWAVLISTLQFSMKAEYKTYLSSSLTVPSPVWNCIPCVAAM